MLRRHPALGPFGTVLNFAWRVPKLFSENCSPGYLVLSIWGCLCLFSFNIVFKLRNSKKDLNKYHWVSFEVGTQFFLTSHNSIDSTFKIPMKSVSLSSFPLLLPHSWPSLRLCHQLLPTAVCLWQGCLYPTQNGDATPLLVHIFWLSVASRS